MTQFFSGNFKDPGTARRDGVGDGGEEGEGPRGIGVVPGARFLADEERPERALLASHEILEKRSHLAAIATAVAIAIAVAVAPHDGDLHAPVPLASSLDVRLLRWE